MPRERVGRAAELLLDHEPLDVASSPARRARARAARRRRRAPAPRAGSARRPSAVEPPELRVDLARDQDLVDERLRPLRRESSPRRVRPRGSQRAAARASARARILDAAVKLIAREGINDVRIARIAQEAGVSAVAAALPLRLPRRPAGRGARALLRARRDDPHRPRRRAGAGRRAAAGDDRPVPARAGRAARRLAAVGRAVAARRAPPGAAPDRREALRAHARVVRRDDRRGRRERRVHASPTPTGRSTACSR